MTPDADLTAQRKREILDTVLASDTLARCDQLRNLLRYIGERSIAGQGREITEYRIAVDALGRPADFSPADDSSVRSRAYELRQKLQRYYEHEDPRAAVRLELPKGSYVLRFVAREERKPLPDRRSWWQSPARQVAVLVAGAVLAAGAGYLAGRKAAPPADPVVKEAWGPLADSGSNVLICLATALHMVVRPYMDVVAEGLPRYPAPRELYALYRSHRPLAEGLELHMHPVDNNVPVGYVGAVVTATSVLRAGGVSYQILPERTAPLASMRGRNVLLIGNPQHSTAVSESLAKAPLTLDYDQTLGDMVIVDRRQPGRPMFAPRRGPDKRYTDAYGLITVLPGEGAPGSRRMMVLSGITSVGIHGAAEFLTSPGNLRALRARFRREGLPGFPQAFQVVVECRSNDTLLLASDYRAHVVIGK